MELERLLAVARGDAPADLVLANARLVNVASGEVHGADIAIAGPLVAGLGGGHRARQRVDLGGRYVCPGFIDAHVHVESSLVTPGEMARALVPRGVTTAVSNPHEIANVLGLTGIRYLLDQAACSPLDLLVTLPSCVPATELATSGARLGPEELAELLSDPKTVGLGEVMDFEGLVAGRPRLLDEVRSMGGRPVDGHCPGLGGQRLDAYAAAGPASDHECTSVGEAREKLRRGMRVFLRQGSQARDLGALLPLVTSETERRLCWCTDDRDPVDLQEEGSIDHLVRMALQAGVPPVTAIRMATLNPAEHFRLWDRGLVAPGRRADLVVFSDLDEPRPDLVYCAGRLVAREGELLADRSPTPAPLPAEVLDTVHVDCSELNFRIPATGDRVRVIRIRPGTLVTEAVVVPARIEAGEAAADPGRDLLKMAVIERHHASGRVGLGFVEGMGLQKGAIASTFAHDHHNLVVVGADDASMHCAARAVAAAGGGQGVALGDEVVALLPLPVAGLLSDRPIEWVAERLRAVIRAARDLGSPLHDPLMALSFLALEVIPELRLTDLGLIDVAVSRVVPLFVSE